MATEAIKREIDFKESKLRKIKTRADNNEIKKIHTGAIECFFKRLIK